MVSAGVRKGLVMEDVKLVMIRPREGVSFDPVQMAKFVGSRGDTGAVSEALEDLSGALTKVARTYQEARMDDLIKACRETAQIAGTVGLDRLARVARTVAMLAGTSDTTALAANIARLIRLGEGALTAIWDLQDQIV